MRSTNTALALALSLFAPLSILAGCTTEIAEPGDPAGSAILFEGRPIGAACAFDAQCATHRCNADPEAGTCGECVIIQALGHDCTGPHQGCSSSAVCKDGVCRSVRKVAGETCALEAKGGDLHECDDELYCGYIGDTLEIGMCLPRIPVGEVCAHASQGCVAGAWCKAIEHLLVGIYYATCEVTVPRACDACDAEQYCGDDGECHPGTLQENEVCGIVDGSFVDDECVSGLVCDGKTCVPRPTQGETCVRGACGEGLFCLLSPESDAESYCDTLRAEGEACDIESYVYIPCAAGLECRAKTCRAACE